MYVKHQKNFNFNETSSIKYGYRCIDLFAGIGGIRQGFDMHLRIKVHLYLLLKLIGMPKKHITKIMHTNHLEISQR